MESDGFTLVFYGNYKKKADINTINAKIRKLFAYIILAEDLNFYYLSA